LKYFLIGIASTIAAQVLLFFITFWKKVKWFKLLSGSKLFGHGIEYVYPSQKEAVKDIVNDIRNSNSIRVFCMRAFSFIHPEREFSFALDDQTKKIQLLIADPKTENNYNPEIEFRGNEYKDVTPKSYRRDIVSSLDRLRSIKLRNKEISIRIHDEPAVFRLYIFDNRIYFSFFSPYLSGSQLPIHSAKSKSYIYEGFLRYFERIWVRSKEPW